MSPLARLFFQACWCEADRDGKFKWKPGTMKLRYFPADNCDIDIVSSEVTQQGLVIVYAVDGKEYAYIPSFSKHQHINPREAQSVIPDFTGDNSMRRVTTRDDASGPVISKIDAQVGRERKGREGKELTPKPPSDDIDTIRKAVWRLSGLSEDQIGTKLVSMNAEGIRQSRTWLESHPLQAILDAVADAYDGSDQRGEKIRNPWKYLDQVIASLAEKASAETAEGLPPIRDDPWPRRMYLASKGTWMETWGDLPGRSRCEAPQDIQDAYLAAKRG